MLSAPNDIAAGFAAGLFRSKEKTALETEIEIAEMNCRNKYGGSNMRMKNDQEVNVIKYLIFVLILAVLALSFVPCNKIIKYSSPWSMEITQTVQYKDFLPQICATVTIIELLLLFKSDRIWSKVLRFILNPIKIAFPISWFRILDKIDEVIYDTGETEVYLGWSAYVIIGIGIVIGAAEIIEIISAAKKK